MPDDFFAEDRATTNPILKASVLSSAFSRWRRKYHPYPLYVPPGLGDAVPLPVRQTTRLLREARDDSEPFKYFCRCVELDLCKCGHPEHHAFGSFCAHHAVSAARLDPDDTETDIAFDLETSITRTSVWSLFRGVSESEARKITTLAEPPNWKDAASSFFKQSVPGTWDVKEGRFCRDDAVSSRDHYQLLEFVEWDWSPQAPGGMVNVLDIRKLTTPDPHGLVSLVIDKTGQQNAPELHPGFEKPIALGNYTFRLSRCVQAKFVSTWETGGLDVDQGSYRAAWLRSRDQSGMGTLFIEAIKAIRYSKQADVIPGFSMVLNLLAPALTSMLMNQLAYSGIRDSLAKRGASTATPQRHRDSGHASPHDRGMS